ncbi:protein-L-isoaspartate O-methyltransferase [Sphingomonas sp.]|uniref:protein-L-isoaspartate O-methyltransferase family protein n=1 Tax=Sphingomonas sp. TaxID=28214 RepID=UPI0025CCEB52|nr:protein-L-isoaspartate O-methyltransferase [Sphingomonas sp.]
MTADRSEPADRFEAARRAMVSNQLRTTAVDDPRVIAAMARVPREDFVPPARRDVAYTDIAIPLVGGRALNTPMATARLINEAGIGSNDRVLIVGSATGYAVAIARLLAKSVVGLECDAALATAGDVVGPLEAGAADHGPFDVIIIDGAVEDVPQALIDQLAPGGRLATALVENGVTRLAVGRRGGAGFALTAFADADAVILPGFVRPHAFVF